MHGRTDRADAHPAERCAESVRLDVKTINRVTAGQPNLLFFSLPHLFPPIVVIVVITLDRDARPFTVYRLNV